jgi:hypothetical protein
MQPYHCTVVTSNATLQCGPCFSAISHRHLSSVDEGMAYFHPGLVIKRSCLDVYGPRSYGSRSQQLTYIRLRYTAWLIIAASLDGFSRASTSTTLAPQHCRCRARQQECRDRHLVFVHFEQPDAPAQRRAACRFQGRAQHRPQRHHPRSEHRLCVISTSPKVHSWRAYPQSLRSVH